MRLPEPRSKMAAAAAAAAAPAQKLKQEGQDHGESTAETATVTTEATAAAPVVSTDAMMDDAEVTAAPGGVGVAVGEQPGGSLLPGESFAAEEERLPVLLLRSAASSMRCVRAKRARVPFCGVDRSGRKSLPAALFRLGVEASTAGSRSCLVLLWIFVGVFTCVRKTRFGYCF